MDTVKAMEAIRDEEIAFERQLETFLVDHRDEFVLMKGGVVIGFFKSYADAYHAGVATFGPAQVFLVSQVRPRRAEPVSISWTAGVMFGR